MSSTREVGPTKEHWKLARVLVDAFVDTDCRCDRIVLTEGAKENLKIKVAHALRQREEDVRAEEWLPIESAPKDGTAILVYGPDLLREVDGHCAVVRWQTNEHSTIPWWTISDGKFGPYDLRGPSPTHWQPLTAPPPIRRDDAAQEGEQQ